MSEYQYYEFLACDRRLTPRQMAELRDISASAEITPQRFQSHYHRGDLKADPRAMLLAYFDVHLFFANWGVRRLILRLPPRVDIAALWPYCADDCAVLSVVGDDLVLDVSREEAHDPHDRAWSPGPIAPIREELIQGDYRAAYLIWLMSAQLALDDDALEPPVPADMASLSPAQHELAAFLGLDRDLVAVAAGVHPDAPRTVAALLAARDAIVQQRHAAAAAHQAALEQARRQASVDRATALRSRVDAAWAELATLISTSVYDAAHELAKDLRELARLDGTEAVFADRFAALQKQHFRRRSFFDRCKGLVRESASGPT